MVKLVEGMLALHKRQAEARLPQEKEMIQRQIYPGFPILRVGRVGAIA